MKPSDAIENTNVFKEKGIIEKYWSGGTLCPTQHLEPAFMLSY